MGRLIFVAEYDFITNPRIQIPILQGIYRDLSTIKLLYFSYKILYAIIKDK